MKVETNFVKSTKLEIIDLSYGPPAPLTCKHSCDLLIHCLKSYGLYPTYSTFLSTLVVS